VSPPLQPRFLGVPLLFAVAYSAVGFSIYFALGLVAERGLGLTPLIFLGVGLVFLLNTLTYVEGEAMLRERGGSASFARHAFNEFVSFIAGWAILVDYMIVIALAAISVPHYLEPISSELSGTTGEIAIGGAVIALAAWTAIINWTGVGRQRALSVVAVAGVLLLVAVIVVGAITSWDPGAITRELDLFNAPSLEDAIYSGVIATAAFAGIEVAANLAPELEFRAIDLRRLVVAAATLVPLIYAGVAFVALMALPVVPTPSGPETALGTTYLKDPVLGVVDSFDPAWVSDAMTVAVVLIAPTALIWAASTAMLGLSRHVYVLATNRQIPSWLGRLNRRFQSPHVAILIAAALAFGLLLPTDVMLLGGLFAFGATIAFTIAHASIIRLRMTEPDRQRPFRIPLNVSVSGAQVPVPTIVAAVLTALAWVSVIAYHDTARWVGGGWMVLGIAGYVIYRKVFEGTQLLQRVEVPAEALAKDVAPVQYAAIMVPVFGTDLDDDIVGTAGRLADAAGRPGEEQPRLELVYVIEVPKKLPLDAIPPQGEVERANGALERGSEVASEYETVEVGSSVIRARSVGSGIVQAARDLGVDVIVMGGEPPTKIKGGAVLGGIGGERPEMIGPVTEYVLERAPTRVLITAPKSDGSLRETAGGRSAKRPAPRPGGG
jgi:basic amino acid/polyamine antiporter, APA family